MGVAKGMLETIPKKHTEQFLACFKDRGVDKEKLKQMTTYHKGKRER